MIVTTEIVFVLALAAFMIGLSKGGLGGPVPVALTAPLLSLVLPPAQAVGIVLPLLLFADAFALYFYWQTWDMRYIRAMLPLGVIGALAGTALLVTLPGAVLGRVIGVLTLIAVVYRVMQPRLKALAYQPRRWHGPAAGGLSGFASALANAGAPPFTAYLLMQPSMTPLSFIGTTTLFFAVINALKVPGYLASGVTDLSMLAQTPLVLVLIPLGVWLGRAAVQRMNARLFEQIMLTALFIISLYLIVR
ncbi:sulfite exporter TauE/SafE family protein [Aggregatilineales bacterium SYSU G02658]